MEMTCFLSSASTNRVHSVSMNNGDALQAQAIGVACRERINNVGTAKAPAQNFKDKFMAKLKYALLHVTR